MWKSNFYDAPDTLVGFHTGPDRAESTVRRGRRATTRLPWRQPPRLVDAEGPASCSSRAGWRGQARRRRGRDGRRRGPGRRRRLPGRLRAVGRAARRGCRRDRVAGGHGSRLAPRAERRAGRGLSDEQVRTRRALPAVLRRLRPALRGRRPAAASASRRSPRRRHTVLPGGARRRLTSWCCANSIRRSWPLLRVGRWAGPRT